MQRLLTFAERARKELFKRFKIVLLFAFPFADQIMTTIAANLPMIAPFLPDNIYMWVGPAVVLASVLIDAYKKRQEKKHAG